MWLPYVTRLIRIWCVLNTPMKSRMVMVCGWAVSVMCYVPLVYEGKVLCSWYVAWLWWVVSMWLRLWGGVWQSDRRGTHTHRHSSQHLTCDYIHIYLRYLRPLTFTRTWPGRHLPSRITNINQTKSRETAITWPNLTPSVPVANYHPQVRWKGAQVVMKGNGGKGNERNMQIRFKLPGHNLSCEHLALEGKVIRVSG